MIYQIDKTNKRLLWIGKDRRESTLEEFCKMLGHHRCSKIKYVCSDMWKPYMNVIKRRFINCMHIEGLNYKQLRKKELKNLLCSEYTIYDFLQMDMFL